MPNVSMLVLVGWLVGWLVKLVQRRVISERYIYWRDRDPRRWGKRETIPNTRQSLPEHHIKMGSDNNHFNVLLTVRGKVKKTVSINHNF